MGSTQTICAPSPGPSPVKGEGKIVQTVHVMLNIFLTGFSYTGKSQVGRLVASSLGWDFIDTDQLIAQRAGKPIHRIFEEEGEHRFRQLEKESLKEACSREKSVVSTGGGAVLDEESRRLMLERGLVVCLDALPETIHQRLRTAQASNPSEVRPVLKAPDALARIHQLKAQRQLYYSQAHWTVHTDNLTVEETAREVVRAWNIMRGKRIENRDDPSLAAVVTYSTGSYPVLVGWGLLDELGEWLLGLDIAGQVYIITDENVFVPYVRQSQNSLQRSGIVAHVYSVPPGEASKSLEMAQHIYQWLVERKAERKHAIVAIGGGVVGDLAGYVAAIFLRGLPLVQVPTSLTAMVDAAIGGKVAVNLPQGKNLVGAFYQPAMVLADVQALSTLGRRELAEGWAEAIKHGLILDADLFQVFEERAEELMALEKEITAQVIKRSMVIKARVVSEDERETTGRRTLLNYGHTIGHALETVTGYGQYLHGEAVAVGMMGAAFISHRMGLIDQSVVERQERLLQRFGLPTTAPGVDREQVLQATTRDKKVESGAIKWVLLGDIGRAVIRRDVPQDVVEEAVDKVLGSV